jgi:hypothetical protein
MSSSTAAHKLAEDDDDTKQLAKDDDENRGELHSYTEAVGFHHYFAGYFILHNS